MASKKEIYFKLYVFFFRIFSISAFFYILYAGWCLYSWLFIRTLENRWPEFAKTSIVFILIIGISSFAAWGFDKLRK
jgi:hypothetical protein